MDPKWHIRFLGLARHVAGWSRDPSTKVGAVITKGKRIVSLGYNGFPQGVDDSPERYNNRETKYKMIVHAEKNAILFAGVPLTGCTLYTWPFPPCSPCAGMIIQAGINRVIAPHPSEDHLTRWGTDFILAGQMFDEAGVLLELYTPTD